MAYIKTFIILCLCVLIRIVYSESNCGTSLCVSTNVIKPGEPVHLSWHKSDNPNGLQISLLYGDNSDKTDCHELQGQQVLRSWKLNHGEEEYSITINEVDFDIENKTFVFLVEYLTSNFCMMAPSGPKGLGTSYVVFDKVMPVKKPEVNEPNTPVNGDNPVAKVNDDINNTNNDENDKTAGNTDDPDGKTNDDPDNPNENNEKNENNNGNNTDPNDAPGDKDKQLGDDDDDGGFFNTFNIILFIIIGIILLILICCVIAYFVNKMRGKDKNSNADSLKQNSTTRMLSPTLTDDAFAEDSVYSAVNINDVIPPPPQNPTENLVPNVSVESFNSSTSQSGLISRHEAKMIAERFRCELQNPLNNEVDDASSIKDKKEETV